MAEDIKLSKAEIEELRQLIRLLREDMDSVQFENLLKSGPAAKRALNDLRREATEFTSDLSGAVQSFKTLINQIQGTKSGVNQVLGAFKGIYKVAEEIQYAQRDITNLTEKDIAKLQEKLAMKRVDLENADKILKAEQKSYEKAEKFDQDQIKFYKEEQEKLLKKNTLTKEDERRFKDLEKLEKEALKRLDNTQDKLKGVKENQEEIAGIINQQDGNYNTLTATLATINRQLEDQKKLLGLGGAAIGGLDAALNKLGFSRLAGALGISEAKSEMDALSKKIIKDRETQLILEREINNEMKARAKGEGKLSPEVLAEKYKQLNALKDQNAQYDGMNGKLAVLKKGVSSMGTSLIKNLTDPLTLTVGLVTQLVGALQSSDKATGELAKQFGKSYDQASNTRQELNALANSTGNVNVTTQALQESVMEVGKALGTNAKLNDADLITMTKLTKQAGYTYDELMGIQKLSLANNKTLDDNVKEIQGAARAYNAKNKLAINEKDVLKEVNKASASLKLSLGGSVTALTEAVMKTKQFGLSLDQAESMAKSLLDFESSISAEMEAEMLTGKSLNLEKARYLALSGDAAGAAAEIARQVGSAAEFGKMNVIQQEAIAKAAGLSREELSKSLIEKEALAKLNDKESKSLQEAYNKMKERGMTEAQIKAKLGDQVNTQQLESQSLQDKFNASVVKLQEIFVSLADPILEMLNTLRPVFDIIGKIAAVLGQVINKITAFGKYLGEISNGWIPKILGGIVGIGIALGVVGLAASKLGSIFGAMLSPIKLLGKGIASLIPKDMGGILGKIKDKLTPASAAGATPSGTSSLSGAADEAKNTKNLVAKLFDGIKDIINSIKDVFRSLIKFVKDIAKDLLSALKEIIKGIGKVLSEGVDIVVNLANKLAGGAMKVLNTVISGLTQASKSLPTILGNIGKAIGSFFSGLSTGLVAFAEAMAMPTILFGLPVGLIVVGMAMGLATAARIAAPAIAALGPMFEGLAKVVEAMAPAIEAAGKAIKSVFEGIGSIIESVGKSISIVITSIADSIVKLSDINAANLFAVAGGIGALGVALAAFGGGGLFTGLSSAIGKFFDEDPVEKFNKFANIEADKILKVADAITALKNAINNFGEATLKIGDTSNIENTINKLMEMYDEFEETPVEKVINQVATGASNLFEQASSWVSSLFPSPETSGVMPETQVNTPSSVVNNNNTSTLNVNNANLVEEMKAVKAVLVQILNKDSNVYMDSTKVGTALNLSSVRI